MDFAPFSYFFCDRAGNDINMTHALFSKNVVITGVGEIQYVLWDNKRKNL
jgi:hypothetical protein